MANEIARVASKGFERLFKLVHFVNVCARFRASR
jgi:hypothetical protein